MEFFKIKYPWTGHLLWQLSHLLQNFLTTLSNRCTVAIVTSLSYTCNIIVIDHGPRCSSICYFQFTAIAVQFTFQGPQIKIFLWGGSQTPSGEEGDDPPLHPHTWHWALYHLIYYCLIKFTSFFFKFPVEQWDSPHPWKKPGLSLITLLLEFEKNTYTFSCKL